MYRTVNDLAMGGARPLFLGIEPVSAEWGAELTPPVRATLPSLLDLVIEQLHAWNR